MNEVPVIDLGGSAAQNTAPNDAISAAVADGAERFGFFQIVNHGIPANQIEAVWSATRSFFAQPTAVKRQIERSRENARGYYDRELTKNRRDLKEVLDLSFADSSDNTAIDGVNQWPDIEGFRLAIDTYLASCNSVALWLLQAFCQGLGEHAQHLAAHFDPVHTSFLRLNHYPLGDLLAPEEAAATTALGDMALHHHTDAGALTLLLQDDIGGLQVEHDGSWIDVPPIEGALVVNTGDMMQVWSNDRYRAALHRVAPRVRAERFSLPYFFNPSYDTDYEPLAGSIADGDTAHYRSINWGEFRKARADGDYADYGAEVQIAQFEIAR